MEIDAITEVAAGRKILTPDCERPEASGGEPQKNHKHFLKKLKVWSQKQRFVGIIAIFNTSRQKQLEKHTCYPGTKEFVTPCYLSDLLCFHQEKILILLIYFFICNQLFQIPL